MADMRVECKQGWWWGQMVLHVLVLLGFSAGAIAAIAVLLYHRRGQLEEEHTQKYFGMLYLTYQPARYYYEAVNMSFKVLLWMAAVMFDYGSQLQLARAARVYVCGPSSPVAPSSPRLGTGRRPGDQHPVPRHPHLHAGV